MVCKGAGQADKTQVKPIRNNMGRHKRRKQNKDTHA